MWSFHSLFDYAYFLKRISNRSPWKTKWLYLNLPKIPLIFIIIKHRTKVGLNQHFLRHYHILLAVLVNLPKVDRIWNTNLRTKIMLMKIIWNELNLVSGRWFSNNLSELHLSISVAVISRVKFWNGKKNHSFL